MLVKRVAVSVLALAFSAETFAHFPLLECKELVVNKTPHLQCLAGFSDGSLSGKVELKVFSYDEVLLNSVKTAEDGSVTFLRPEGEFYIVFDAEHETPAEFDYAELD